MAHKHPDTDTHIEKEVYMGVCVCAREQGGVSLLSVFFGPINIVARRGASFIIHAVSQAEASAGLR